MKTLVIFPDSKTDYDSPFYLLDPETGEGLASHFCSGASWAKSDLHDRREDRLEEFEKRFGEKTEAKFIDETNYEWSEVLKKNRTFAPKEKSF